jgi:hypothetical protein
MFQPADLHREGLNHMRQFSSRECTIQEDLAGATVCATLEEFAVRLDQRLSHSEFWHLVGTPVLQVEIERHSMAEGESAV